MHSHARTSAEIDDNFAFMSQSSFSYSFSGNCAAKFSKKIKCLRVKDRKS